MAGCFEILDKEEEGTTSCKKKKKIAVANKISMDATLMVVLLELEGIFKLNKNINTVLKAFFYVVFCFFLLPTNFGTNSAKHSNKSNWSAGM